MSINQEKQKIIDQEGNILVTANPGTGKTRLLAYKYIDLINKGIGPDEILCLTFTEKAKKEMESRILEVIKDEKVKVDVSKLNVFTFHSFALDNIDENEILSTNLLRYSILRYLKDNEILNYSDEYLIETIVPRMENLMRYLKSFGIMPNQINIIEVKGFLEEGKNYTKEEIDIFADHFLAIFQYYENIKNRRGVDYADLLIKYLQLRTPPQFKHVLIDELQDVNTMEADIALRSGKQFFAVGDKKQAIFGFQGGSILNFQKFDDSKQSVLSENFRSTNEVLAYAREYFIAKTKEESHKNELKDLRNAEGKKGPKPVIYDANRDQVYAIACELLKGLEGKTAIIARTNFQIAELGKELKARGLDFSSTFFSASEDTQKHIITFLRGVLSLDIQDVKNSMFTPFFPCSLQEAFAIADTYKLTIEQIFQKVPAFKELRDSVKTVEDVNKLFRDRVIPICISYGKEYLSAGLSMQSAYQEAISVLQDKDMQALMSYLQSTDLLSQESDVEKQIVLTTVHKAKGKEFDNVIYIPSKTGNKSSFQDKIVEAILKSKGINVEEELEEETLRVNFVAFTRAMNKLIILTDKIQDYLNDYAELGNTEASESACIELSESKHRAYDLFVNKRFEEAKALLENKDEWLKDYVKNYFLSLEHISFTSLPEKAFDYFVDKILGIREISYAKSLGSEVHEAANQLLLGKEYSASKDAKPFIENVKALIAEIKKDYPDGVMPEMKLEPELTSMGFDSSLKFKSYIDAVFRKGDEYLIVDWKTDKKIDNASKHRQQLEAYRRVFSAKENIPIEKIKVAIGFVGLRGTINTGRVDCELNMRQPVKSAFETFSNRVNKLLSWIKDPEQFLKEFAEDEVDEMIWRSVVEEYKRGE